MTNFSKLAPFDEAGRVQMVVETPRGGAIKFKWSEEKGIFTISRSLTLGLSYPFDWGFVPGTMSEDGDAVDALCLHHQESFPGVLLPCRCAALVDVDQKGAEGRIGNPRVILVPAWEGGEVYGASLSARVRAEIEQFFLNTTLFTAKDARIAGWRDAAAAEAFIRGKTA